MGTCFGRESFREMQKKNPVGGGEHLHVRQCPSWASTFSPCASFWTSKVTSRTIQSAVAETISTAPKLAPSSARTAATLAKHAWCVGEFEANGQAVVGIGSDVGHGWSLLLAGCGKSPPALRTVAREARDMRERRDPKIGVRNSGNLKPRTLIRLAFLPVSRGHAARGPT